MNETLQEFVTSRGIELRVDQPLGVIRGVKILGLESRNGRSYLPEALAAAVPLYEEAKVNVNHPKGDPLAPRDYQDRLGVIRNVAARPEGLFADLHFNPKHALAEQLLWDAAHAPENVGFSHNVQARTSRQGDRVVVEAITKVQSVDLVADPATTRGLFEATATGDAAPRSEAEHASLASVTLDDLKRQRPDLVEQLLHQPTAEVARLQGELDRLQTLEAVRQKQEVIHRLLAEHHLPDANATDPWSRLIVSPPFLESLLAASDESQMRAMVEQRARSVQEAGFARTTSSASPARPLSREQQQVEGTSVVDVKRFVEAIT
ncbi:MAG: hypothetical protein ABFD16_12205 [Thermoguttaceae bacterium]